MTNPENALYLNRFRRFYLKYQGIMLQYNHYRNKKKKEVAHMIVTAQQISNMSFDVFHAEGSMRPSDVISSLPQNGLASSFAQAKTAKKSFSATPGNHPAAILALGSRR